MLKTTVLKISFWVSSLGLDFFQNRHITQWLMLLIKIPSFAWRTWRHIFMTANPQRMKDEYTAFYNSRHTRPQSQSHGGHLRWLLMAAMGLLTVQAGVLAAPIDKQEVVIYPKRIITSDIFGLGVQWEQYAYPPSAREWKIILQRVNFMHPGFLRVMSTHNHGHWKVQPEVPLILRWAQNHHSRVILGTWWAPPLYHRYAHTPMPSRQLRRWADTTARTIARFRRQDGYTCIHYYNFINEPQNVSIALWTSVAQALHAALVRAGLAGAVSIIGPDTYWWNPGNSTTYNFPLLRQVAQDAGPWVGLYDIHWYPHDAAICNGRIESTLIREKRLVESLDLSSRHKPFVVSESGLIDGRRRHYDQQPRVKHFDYGVLMADYAAQVFRAGWDGISAWDLDDALCVDNGQPVIHPPGKLTLKVWGFWNSQGAVMGDSADFNIRSWFYTWSLMSRLFSPGTRIVESDEPIDAKQFRTLAGIRMVHGHRRISIMLVNDSEKPRNIVIRVVADTSVTTFTEYRYFRKHRPVNAQGFPLASTILHTIIPAHGISVSMPGRGVILLTNRRPLATGNGHTE